MKLVGLGRQIGLAITAMVVLLVAIFVIGSYVIWALLVHLYPGYGADGDYGITIPDVIWMFVILGCGLAIGSAVSVRLAQRILKPLNSVADGMRRVAQGDLSARAIHGDRSLGETAQLVDDFNTMTSRFQQIDRDLTLWNAAIAHELRTPVTVLRGRLEGLANGVFPPEQSQFTSLLTQVEGLSRLIEDLRVLSLAEGHQLYLQLGQIEAIGEIRAVVAVLQPVFANVQSTLTMRADCERLMLTADAVRIRQATLALLENARRYATPGEVQVIVTHNDKTLTVSVHDHGPGVRKDIQDAIFEPFARGAGPDRMDERGSGLGLAVVRAIALAHGGNTRCTDNMPSGAAFSFTIPRGVVA